MWQEPTLLEHKAFVESLTCKFDVPFFIQEDATARMKKNKLSLSATRAGENEHPQKRLV